MLLIFRNIKSETPFPTTGYTGPDNYCDREKETDKIIQYQH
jgi:hypothetical protein